SDYNNPPQDNLVYHNIITGNKYAVYFARRPGFWGWLPSNWRIYDNFLFNDNDFGTDAQTGELPISLWNTNLAQIPVDIGFNIIGGSWRGGNYYSNPTATGFSDLCSDGNGDGICDSAYTVAENNIDNYPLRHPYVCTGTVPANAILCPDDNQNLPGNRPRVLVDSCRSSIKCEYICRTGYVYQGGVCVAISTGTISISSSPSTGNTGTIVTIPISINANIQEIETFGLEFTYDTTMFNFQSVNAGNLTSDWAAVDGNDVAGTVTIGGFRGSGTAIPPSSTGTIAVVTLTVTCGGCSDGQQSQPCINNYMDGITGMTPEPTCTQFTYTTSSGATCYCDSCSTCNNRLNRATNPCSTVYLTQDISSSAGCISIGRNNRVLDCQNYKISGPGAGTGRGINIENVAVTLNNIEIRNCEVENFQWGISFFRNGANNVYIHDSHVHNVGWAAIRIAEGDDCIVENNIIENGPSTGVRMVGGSERNQIRNNIIRNFPNEAAVWGFGSNSRDNYIYNNRISQCNRAVGLHNAGNPGNLPRNWVIYNNYITTTDILRSVETPPTTNTLNTNLQAGTNIDGGPWVCGNYLSNPTGTGYSDTCTDSDTDGICDSAYTIDTNNVDNCPLASDRSTPTTTINPDGQSWTNNDVGFTLTCVDPISGCDTTYYKIIDDGQPCGSGYTPGTSGTVTCSAGQTCRKRVCFYSTDVKGNAESVKTSNIFYIDKSAPSTSINQNGSSWTGQNVDFTLSCSDPDSGCDTTYYKIINSGQSCGLSGYTPGTSGTVICNSGQICRRRVCFYSDDNVGNIELPEKSAVFRIDKQGPTVSVTGAPANWQNTDATAGVSCTDSASGCDVNSYRLHISATSISNCPTDYNNDYSPPGTQTISFHSWVCGAARDNVGNTGFSSPVEFLIDKTGPTATLNPLPTWTNQNSVIVGWNGSDTQSGVDYFELQYRIRTIDGSPVQGWTDWTTSSSNPGTLPFSGMENNRTYQFRARAIDNAGNTGGWSSVEGISVDMVAPTCQMEDLPIYTNTTIFTVNWSGSDGESGIQHYDVQARAETTGCGLSTTWDYLNGLDDTTETSYERGYQEGCTYFFRCRATDIADNEGGWSAVKNTTVDTTKPISSVDTLTRWLNVTSFTVTWSGFDLICYDIQWSDDNATWNDWFGCTTNTSSVFGPSSPTTVIENTTYYFRSRGRDAAGHIEDWPPVPDAYTTIDLTTPEYTLRAEDEDGNEISGYITNVDRIILKSNATDSISGVAQHYIEYILTLDEGMEIADSVDCGSASPYGGISECNVTVEFTGAIMMDYWVRVIDRAGNINMSNNFNIGTHPLANFARHNIHMVMGESSTVKIYVRNVQAQSDNVTITLNTTLPVPPYFIGLGEFVLDNTTWVGDEVDLKDNNKTIVVKNLIPGEFKIYNVLLWSVEPELDVYQLILNAYSVADQ
ncbi:MAG: right-handed parallel beta-helix repeat-containing protein, partial [Candidatus Aenigmatarchaeota archaeon]